MSIESEVFKKYVPNYNKLVKYGFKKSNNEYRFSKKFMNNTFRADIVINDNGEILGKVIEIELDEEYTNFRIEGSEGEFVGKVREEYKNILWDRFPGYGVFRNKRSNKWFGIIMNIDRSKINSDESGEIEVLNVKLDDDVQNYLGVKGIYPSYHLSKKSWITIILDDTLSDKKIMELVDLSYDNVRE